MAMRWPRNVPISTVQSLETAKFGAEMEAGVVTFKGEHDTWGECGTSVTKTCWAVKIAVLDWEGKRNCDPARALTRAASATMMPMMEYAIMIAAVTISTKLSMIPIVISIAVTRPLSSVTRLVRCFVKRLAAISTPPSRSR